ncbi:MauE/DoxX family redox-associated membrane protein [Cellulophaga sp. Hel_I_12]|uniref:MauE/DoxX family redox-associated membrane protein n=1 Tax=Cellulophaga sp. Hel_I_12 TaxID=1249972 RepID=UPI0006489796|nr:MauE/DoxX family redox-associated membrane protein [Cellulophaga sp. Hel_I_12]
MATPKIPLQIIVKTICFLFILLWVYAATSKLLMYDEFQIQLSKSPFVSKYSSQLVWIIPLTEYVLAGLFLFQKYILNAFYLSLSMMALFTLYILFVLNFSESIPCSCGGIIGQLSWNEHLFFNVAFILLAFLGIVFLKRQKHIQS